MVGAGTAGVELILAMHHRINIVNKNNVHFSLIGDQAQLLPEQAPRVRMSLSRLLTERNISVHLGSPVQAIRPGELRLANGVSVPSNFTVWATGATAPAWLARAGLGTDERGFVRVNEMLQSITHSQVYAAGDIVCMVNSPRAKSGVHAVRQGPPLARNLRQALLDQPHSKYRPRRRTLAIISAGDRYAVATRGNWSVSGKWVWWWKHWIDQRFMARYRVTAPVRTVA